MIQNENDFFEHFNFQIKNHILERRDLTSRMREYAGMYLSLVTYDRLHCTPECAQSLCWSCHELVHCRLSSLKDYMEEKERNTGKFKLVGGSTGLLSVTVQNNDQLYEKFVKITDCYTFDISHNLTIFENEPFQAGLGIAGILFMPVSGGLSLGLTIAGVGTGLAAGGMTTGSDIYKKKKHRQGIILFSISCLQAAVCRMLFLLG